MSCPFNLGGETSCGRVVDEVSCYCATFTQRDWASQLDFCRKNNYSLVSLESFVEEQAIYSAWGKGKHQ